MRASTFVELAVLAALSGCAGGQATIGSSVGEKGGGQAMAAEPIADAGAGGAADSSPKSARKKDPNEPEPPPPPDPALVKALVDKTGEPAKSDNPLHLRLEVTPRPAGELWLVGVVNRGTEPARVAFDLRRLTLALETPEDPKKPRSKWQKKPAAVVCKLPEGFGGPGGDASWRALGAGEGLLQTFDPRLYCISAAGDALLATGQKVTVKLGYPPKPPHQVWRQGKKSEVPAPQSAPFIAEPVAEPAGKPDPEHDPRVKELVASEVTLTADLTAAEAEEDPTLPLQLRLVHGSDAATEMSATAVVEVRAKQKSQLYFRRELVSFVVHGPDGIHECDPQPDNRSPDGQAYTRLAAGQSVSATSLLAELCPKYTFGRAGLYLVSARLDADRDGSEFGLSAFTGRLESRREALIRIKVGDFPPLQPPEPLLVKVGQ
ncbi:MAG TPA: hypothetical protein VNG33_06630 [Polyangiaceae bacterium]|nr:hypothetical protein [Polyangiaceae bacterium]